MKTELYIVIWHEAIEATDLISGIFTKLEDAEKLHADLERESSGDYWQIVTKQVELP